jgi:hypothetical protein
MASDNNGSGEGWRIDNVTITWCHQGQPCTPIPRPTPPPRVPDGGRVRVRGAAARTPQ